MMNFFWNIFTGGKLKCRYYFDNTEKTINFPSMNTNISIVKGVDITGELGKINTKNRITVPSGISDKLIQLDQNQYNLAVAINALPKNERSCEIKKYIQVLLDIHELVSKNSNGSVKTLSSIDNISTSNNIDSNLKKYLDDRHFKSTALPDNLNLNQGYVIWPVALLTKTTYIHKAQSQLIKLLTDCGWKLLVVIGDCGKNSNIKDQVDFINGIKKIIESQNISFESNAIARISDYYEQDDMSDNKKLIPNVTGTKILKSFHNISEGLVWNKFDLLIKKNYDDPKKTLINNRSVLNNIQPLLTWALVATIVKESKSKAIVIAGEDEQEQWDYVTNNHTNNNLGVIYIHELKKEDNKTMDQEDLLIRNTQEMRSKLQVGNMAEWLYTHFIELPKFATKEKPAFCKISDDNCKQYHDNCINCLFRTGQHFQDVHFDKDGFVDTVYPLSNPAN